MLVGMKGTEILTGDPFQVDFANETGAIRVVPFSDAPQSLSDGTRVTQRFDKASAETIVGTFRANAARLLAKLGFANSSIPFYNGHPDTPQGSADSRDTEVYAEAVELEVRDDGLWATIRRKPVLKLLIEALGKLEISPRWLCRLDEKDGTYKPFNLLSFGLVKNGNIPNADMINSLIDWKSVALAIASELGVNSADTPESEIPPILLSEFRKLVRALETAKSEAKALQERAKRAEEDEAKARATGEARGAALRNAAVQAAVGSGAMSAAQGTEFLEEFCNAETEEALIEAIKRFSNAIRDARDTTVTDAVNEAAEKPSPSTPKENADALVALIDKLAQEKGITNAQAFARAMHTAEGRAYYENAKIKVDSTSQT